MEEGREGGRKGERGKNRGDQAAPRVGAKIRVHDQLGGPLPPLSPNLNIGPNTLATHFQNRVSTVPTSLCHHLPTPSRHIPGYVPHSRCWGVGEEKGGTLHFHLLY